MWTEPRPLAGAPQGSPAFDPATATLRVRLGSGDLGASTIGSRLLAWIATHAPGVEVDLVLATGPDDPRLRSGELDLVAGASSEALAPDHGTLLWSSPLVGLVRTGHPLATRPPTLRAFAEARHVLVTPPLMAEGIVERTLRGQGAGCRVAMRVPYWLALPGLLAESDLVAAVPSLCAGELTLQGGLATFPLPVSLPDHAVWLAWSPARARDPVVVWLRDLVVRLTAEQVADWAAEGV